MASIRSTNIGDTLTIKKISQIFGNLLANQHADGAYGMTSDQSKILNVGTQLKVIGKGKAQTRYRDSYVTVSYNQYTFDIMSTDLRQFCN